MRSNCCESLKVVQVRGADGIVSEGRAGEGDTPRAGS
jgi:hypothetical protein